MEIRFLDVAQQEFDEAVEYYNAESLGLGDQFLLEALDSLERVRQFPKAWHPYTENSRQCQTRRFPFGIVYQVLESEILASSPSPTCIGSRDIGWTGLVRAREQEQQGLRLRKMPFLF